MPESPFVAYKGLDLMPTWFAVMVAVLVVIGIALAAWRRDR
ncbi:hypothetical protein NX794_05045 [Streptomyces sp. LP11]|uniref:Uncharacterized protein n=1 Tax=Streptomyces pyxinicus TaxID=2970331 RepID=A0ABT2AXI6_9ACTN|nr:hypothetical protein [Streptomyces sp. LP11]MCS0600600.1 hypothetical protein [Streptomyces sp. LP11]